MQRYGQLIEKHLNRTVLAHLPKEHWRNLDSPEMIERPDINCYVFCRVNEDVIIKQSNVDQKKNDGKVNNDDNDDVIPGMSPDFAHEHKAGSTLIVRYQTIRELVRDGKVTMLT